MSEAISTTGRTAAPAVESAPVTETKPVESKDAQKTIDTESDDIPFVAYEATNGHPFFANYYDIKQVWKDPSGGYEDEVRFIEDYFKKQIEKGQINGSTQTVRAMIKGIEKQCNVRPEDTMNMKITKTNAYIKFLSEVDDMESQRKRWS